MNMMVIGAWDAEARRERYANMLHQQTGTDVVRLVENDLLEIALEARPAFIRECVPDAIIRLAPASTLRAFLPPNDRVRLALSEADTGNVSRELLEEAATAVAALPVGSTPRTAFWNGAIKHVQYQGLLWDHAPDWRCADLRAAAQARDVGATRLQTPSIMRRRSSTPPDPESRGASSASDRWRQIDWQAKLQRQPLRAVISDATAMIYRIRDERDRSCCVRMLPASVLLDVEAISLLRLLSEDDKAEVYCSLVTGPALTTSELRRFLEYLRALRIDRAIRVWLDAVARSPHRDRLEREIPDGIAREMLRRAHAQYLKHLEQVTPYPLPCFVSFEAQQMCHQLSDDDRRLADLWAGREASEFERAKMLSARMAELATKRYYEGLGHAVADVAISQVRGASSAWKTHDLLLDGEQAVDVKNARTTINSKGGYSEHALPRFKQDRDGTDVVITGVRSPYLTLDQLHLQKEIYFLAATILVLGECSRVELEALRETFVSEQLHDITFERPDQHARGVQEFLPPWVFSSPRRFDDIPSVLQYRSSIARVLEHDAPDRQALARLGLNPLPLYLQHGATLPAGWVEDLSEWAGFVAHRLTHHIRGSLPRLFLTLLTDFLDAVQTDRTGYTPAHYRAFLFPTTSTTPQLQPSWKTIPFGIFDPLESVESLVVSLERLWEHRATSRLSDFVEFQLTGSGLLRGRRRDHQARITLLAYCGGWIQKRGRCGNSPLILGEHQSCAECCYLVCDACGHCSERCEARVRRQESTAPPGDPSVAEWPP